MVLHQYIIFYVFLFKIDKLCEQLETSGVPCNLNEQPSDRRKRAIEAMAKHAMVRKKEMKK